MVRTVIRMIPADAIAPAMGNERSPRRKVCGTGPIKSMGLLPTKARTELVPRINAKAIMGDAMITERPMSRAGERVSPARIATYSNQLNAPTGRLVKIFRPWKLATGGSALWGG